jgi:hypothetical protein
VAAVAEVQLVIVEGPNTGRDFDLAGSLIVGRGEDAGIVIDDDEASRRHASLSSTGDSVLVQDLGSTNGTFVNGERISSPEPARGGDRIRIGNTVFEVRALTQATRLGTAIPDEPADEPPDVQATAIGHSIPAEEPVETQATAVGHAVPDPGSPPPGGPGAPPPPGSPGAPPAAGGPGAPPADSGGEPESPLSESFPPPFGSPAGADPPPAGPPPPSFPPPTAAPPPGQPPSGYPPPPGPPGGLAPPGQPPAPWGGAPPGGFGAYPIAYDVEYPHQGIARWRPFLHYIMAFPHLFVLLFLGIGAFFAFAGAWLAILFTGRYPRGIFDFLVGYQRWSARVSGFVYLLTERYPDFTLADDPTYPIHLSIRYPESGIARWRVLLQGIMAFPHFFVLWFLGIAAGFAAFIAAIAIIFTRRYPPELFNFIVGWQRWTQRATGFALLMTEEYPPFGLT